jgi:hypothetical protein
MLKSFYGIGRQAGELRWKPKAREDSLHAPLGLLPSNREQPDSDFNSRASAYKLAPFCFTVKMRPATIRVPVRVGPGLAATV